VKESQELKNIEKVFDDLFPINRSITGEGLRQTLKYIKRNFFPEAEIKSVNSGQKVFDWQVPDEWIIKDAYVKNVYGKKIIDFKKNNLHLVSYSSPINKILTKEELLSHIHTLDSHPEWIPYRTTYYKKNWGFCCAKELLASKEFKGPFEVVIESSFNIAGKLNWLEFTKIGKSKKEILISTYCCHPSMANDNLSGIILWTFLLRELKKLDLENNYIFAIHPETIGAIAYLKTNEKKMKKVEAGSVLTTVAGPGKYSIKKSFLQNSIMDRVNLKTFKDFGVDYIEYDFDPDAGSDERQYSSQYFGIPMTSICKDKYFEYDFYHTSKDNLDFISSIDLIETLNLYLSSISKLERNFIYKSLNPKCEPMLGKRGLYPSIGGQLKQNSNKDNNDDDNSERTLSAINWLMYLCDGKNDILDIAERTDLNFDLVSDVAQLLEKNKLLKRLNK